MAGAGEVEQAVAGPSEVGRAAAGSGEGGLSPLHSLDDPCTARLRLRRLLAYLRGHGYRELYLAARRITPVSFHTKDLGKKIKKGQWAEATMYVISFAPFRKSGYEAKLLLQFLMDFRSLDGFTRHGIGLSGKYLWRWIESLSKKPLLSKYPCFATLVEDVVSDDQEHAKAFLDWQLVRNKAAKLAEEMASKTPELRDSMRYLRGRSDLNHVVPAGSKRCVKKTFGRKQSAAALAHYYLQMKKRLPTDYNFAALEPIQEMLHGEPLIALFETSLEAGRRHTIKDGLPPNLHKEGVPFVQTKASGGFSLSLRHQPGLSYGPGVPFVQTKPAGGFRLTVTYGNRLQHQPGLYYRPATKRGILQVSTAHPGNPSKKLRTTGNDPSPSFEAAQSLTRNEGTK